VLSKKGHGSRDAILSDEVRWTYSELKQNVDRIAHVLRSDLGLVPGNRVLPTWPEQSDAVCCLVGGHTRQGASLRLRCPCFARENSQRLPKKGAIRFRPLRSPSDGRPRGRRRSFRPLGRACGVRKRRTLETRHVGSHTRNLLLATHQRSRTSHCWPSHRVPPDSPKRQCTFTGT